MTSAEPWPPHAEELGAWVRVRKWSSRALLFKLKTPTEPRPEHARKWGKCLGCGQWHWLFEYEGGPNDLLCEGCIDEFHARVHDAQDRMAQGSERESEEWAEEYYEEPDGEGFC